MVTGVLSAQTSPSGNMVTSVGGPQLSVKEQVKSDRRSNKPIMEKRRRARINNCLNELKTLILDATKKDPARHTKLEKADILEKTVKHLQDLQRQQSVMTQAIDPKLINKFKAGFAECTNEVSRFPGIDQNLKRRLLQHLTSCMNGVMTNELVQHKNSINSQIYQYQSVQVHILPSPPSSPEQDHSGQMIHHHQQPQENQHHHHVSQNIQHNINGYHLPNGLQVTPTRLPNGNIAIVLPQNTSHSHTQQVPALIPIPSRTSSTSSAASTSSLPYDRNCNISPSSSMYTSPSSVISYEAAMDYQPSQIQHASSSLLPSHHSLQYDNVHQSLYNSLDGVPLSLVIKKIKEEDQPWRPW